MSQPHWDLVLAVMLSFHITTVMATFALVNLLLVGTMGSLDLAIELGRAVLDVRRGEFLDLRCGSGTWAGAHVRSTLGCGPSKGRSLHQGDYDRALSYPADAVLAAIDMSKHHQEVLIG